MEEEEARDCGFFLFGVPALCTCRCCEESESPHEEDCQCAWCLDDELIP